MGKLRMMMSLVLLSTAPISGAILTDAGVSDEAALVKTEAKWANADRITFVDDHSLFNSGVAKLKVGTPITVYATINYSGDSESIVQSIVTFENVDPALAIDYNGLLLFDGKLATFSYTITLLEPIQTPKLFTVRVSDGQPEDNQYLTPYSQRQTIIEDVTLDSTNTESSSESELENSKVPNEEPETDSSTSSTEVPKVEDSTDISTEPPVGTSSESLEELESTSQTSEESVSSSTESSEEPDQGMDTESSSEKPNTGSSTGVSESSVSEPSTSGFELESKEDGNSNSLLNKTKATKEMERANHKNSAFNKQSRADFPATGENTKNRLFTMGVFITSLVLLFILFMGEKQRK